MPLRYIDFLRDIGQHFSVNRMLAAEAYRSAVRARPELYRVQLPALAGVRLSDLYRTHGCTLQLGGNDQWGNILAGVDLIRRVEGVEAYALTFPLLTTASGVKMGKTAAGAVWLDANLFSPFKYYQYWINTEDADVGRFLKIYTYLPMDEIEQLASVEGAALRESKEVLAYEATRITHGQAAADEARQRSRELFGDGAAQAAPTTTLNVTDLDEAVAVAELFCLAGLSRTRSEARRLIEQGGAYVNGEPVSDPNEIVGRDALLRNGLLLRAGKKRYQRVVAR